VVINENEEMKVSMRFAESKAIDSPKERLFEGFNPTETKKLKIEENDCQLKLNKSLELLSQDEEKLVVLENHVDLYSQTMEALRHELEKVEEKIHEVEVVKDNEVEEHKRDLINKQRLEEKLRMELRAKVCNSNPSFTTVYFQDYEIQALKSQVQSYEATQRIFAKTAGGASNRLSPSAVEMSNQLRNSRMK
jgi:hypothetical protein